MLLALALAQSSGSNETVAACMWQQMPTSTAAFVDNTDGGSDFTLYMKASAPCADHMPKNLRLNNLRKILAKSRPAVIAADLATSDNAYVCPKGANGEPQGCKPAGQ